jgi:dedicator of cytokinesis protein 9/10/11
MLSRAQISLQSGLMNRRMLGTYFRLAFFGEKFQELDGKEFIYKEPKIVPLADMALRLQGFYGNRFPGKAFELIQDSADVDPSRLSPEKAYIQLTHVMPYFSDKELRERTSTFERMNNIRRFFYETPFTPEGKARGAIDSQWKRKTILTVDKAFPYLKRRLAVVERQVCDARCVAVGRRLTSVLQAIEQTPIQNAVEEISQKAVDLRELCEMRPPNLKLLQLRLQGTVSVQVRES